MKETHYISKLSAFVDRELTKDEQQTVGEHLMICAACRSEHDRIKFAAGLSADLTRTDASAGVWASIEAGLSHREPPREDRRPIFGLPALAGYAAAALFVAAFISLGYFFLFTGEPYRSEQAVIGPSSPASDPVASGASESPALDRPQPANSAEPVTIAEANTNQAAPTAAGATGSFDVETIAGRPEVGERSSSTNLSVGDYLETDAVSRARIEVANIGNVEIRPNSRVKLVGTSAKEHRLALEHGSLHAKIFAPPRLFIVDTPSATAVDLGCEYTLDVDKAGNNRLHVMSGFVALETGRRESIVPAGAVCLTRKGKGLGTPFSAETSDAFRGALEEFDFAGGGSRSVSVMLANSAFYDMISLWHLLSRVDSADRERVFDALAKYVEPPKDVTKEGVLALNRKMLTSWREEVERTWFE